MSLPSINSFVEDIVVVTFPDIATRMTRLIGWTDMETFREQNRREERDGATSFVLAQDKLFPMEALIELARKTPVLRVQ
jgi:hypothetical protein